MTMMGWGYGGPGMMGGWGGSVFGGLLMLFFWLLFVVGGILLVVWFVRSGAAHRMTGPTSHAPGAPPQQDEALAIARRRLASGEISAEEYEAIRKTLQGS